MQELIYGRNSVYELLCSDRDIEQVLISETMKKASIGKIYKVLADRGIVYKTVPRIKIDSLLPDINHQGIAAEVSSYKYAELEDLLDVSKQRDEAPFLIVLDKIEDPYNLGAILRSADAVGAHGVIIPKRRSVGLTSAVAKTSAGAIEYVPVARVSNISQTIEKLKSLGLWIVGSDVEAEQGYEEVDYDMPMVLVVGSEGNGITNLVKSKCDFLVNIPMRGKIQSLNASVSAALLMYQVNRSRLKK